MAVESEEADVELDHDPEYEPTLKLLEQYKVLRQKSLDLEEYYDFEDEGEDTGSGSDFPTDDDQPRVTLLRRQQAFDSAKAKESTPPPPLHKQATSVDIEPDDRTREQKAYIYINTVPIIGALYGIIRLIVKYRQRDWDEVKQTKWRIVKNLLTTMTLAASALLVPMRKREVIYAAVGTGFLEGITDTVVDYYLLSRPERLETSPDELIFNIMCQTPILGVIYNTIRLARFLVQRNIEMAKKTLWGLSISSITTGLTLISIIKFSLKATGSIPLAAYGRVSVFSQAGQLKVASALVEKGATAPIIKAGKTLARKEGRKLKRKLKKELAELKLKIDKNLENLGEEECSSSRLKLRKRFKRLLESNMTKI